MVDIAEREPDEFTAGDTVEWLKALADYPAPTWSAVYTFGSRSGRFSVAGTDNGDSRHAFEILPVDSQPLHPDTYQWALTVTDATRRFTIARGTTVVLFDATGSPEAEDPRSYAQKLLDAVEDTLAGRATSDQASYSIAGVSLAYVPFPELMEARDRLKAEVARETARDRIEKGLGDSSRVFVQL